MAQAFVKLRKDVDKLFGDPDALLLYIYLLKESNYRETEIAQGKYTVPAGACVRSRATIAKATGLSENQIKHQINHLINTGFLSKYKMGKYSVLSTDCEFINTEKQPNITGVNAPNNQPNKSPRKKNNKEYKKKEILSYDNIKKVEVNVFESIY